jgi:hypothetical protein
LASIPESRAEMLPKLKVFLIITILIFQAILVNVLEFLNPGHSEDVRMSALECILHLSFEEDCKKYIGKEGMSLVIASLRSSNPLERLYAVKILVNVGTTGTRLIIETVLEQKRH